MKRIKKLIFVFLCFICLSKNVYADSISISTNKNSLVVGTSVSVTSKVSSNSPIVSIEGTLSCSGAGVSGGVDLKFDDSSNSIYSNTKTYTVKPTQAGTITCKVSGRMTSMDSATWKELGSKTLTIKVITQEQLQASYSKNNNLSSLTVEGQSLSPEFNKDTLEYSVELENNVEKITVNAKAEDGTATVEGLGEKEVVEGNNKIEIKVIAQNGNEKIYVINAKVKELDPISVKVNDKDYTIVRKVKNLEKPNDFFDETTIKINDNDIPAYINKKAKITLIGLKDTKGDISYFIYDDVSKKYSTYNEINVGGMYLNIKDMPKDIDLSKYKENDLTINKIKVKAYKYKANSDFYLIYATNLENGVDSLYQYDKKDSSIQRYNDEMIKELIKTNKDYIFYTIIVGSSIGTLVIIISILLIVKNKKSKKSNTKKEVKNKKNNAKKDDIVDTKEFEL